MNNTLGKIILFNQIEKRVALFHNSASSSNVSLKKSWILPLLLPLTFCHIADLFKISRGKSAVRRCIVREEMISEWISGYRKGLRVMINCWSGMFSLWLRTRRWKKCVPALNASPQKVHKSPFFLPLRLHQTMDDTVNGHHCLYPKLCMWFCALLFLPPLDAIITHWVIAHCAL